MTVLDDIMRQHIEAMANIQKRDAASCERIALQHYGIIERLRGFPSTAKVASELEIPVATAQPGQEEPQ